MQTISSIGLKNEQETKNIKNNRRKLEEKFNSNTEKEKNQIKELVEKKSQLDDVVEKLNSAKESRTKLLSGRHSDDVENELKDKIRKSQIAFEKVSSDLKKIEIKESELKGNISLLNESILKLENETARLLGNVNIWLSSRQDELSFNDLNQLYKYSTEWISNERHSKDKTKAEVKKEKTNHNK